MKNLRLPILLLFLLVGRFSSAQSSQTIKAYIERYKAIAIEEMIRTGVPAAITLAQGIHETSAGTSVLVTRSNNHFGIKCKSNWTGQTVYHDDDAKGECFRKYEDPAQSYKDHSDFLKTRAHYASLFQLDPTDYRSWAYGLKKAGYATNPKYPQILIKLIEDYDLETYTLIALNQTKPEGSDVAFAEQIETVSAPADAKPLGTVYKEAVVLTPAYPSGVFKINETPVVFITKGMSFLKLADDHNLPLARLFDFNDMKPQEVSETPQLIYLQRKRKKGAEEFHVVQEGETIYGIAQSEGLRLADLCEYNSIKPEMKVQPGEKLNLQTKSVTTPKLRTDEPESTHGISQSSQPIVIELDTEIIIHRVQQKETAYAIARKYAVSVDELLIWNDLTTADLKLGQELRILKKMSNGGY